MKTTIITFILLFSANYAFSQTDYRCFDADNNPNLKISVKYVNEIAVSVKYIGQNTAIPLVAIKSSKKINTSGGIPTSDDSYSEKNNGIITGKYTFTHSGIWDYVTYKRNDGKVFNFTINLDDTVIDGKYRNTPCF